MFGGLLRALDDPSPDPKVRLLRERVVDDGAVGETLTIASHVAHAIETDPARAPRARVRPAAGGEGRAWPTARAWDATGAVGVRAPFTRDVGRALVHGLRARRRPRASTTARSPSTGPCASSPARRTERRRGRSRCDDPTLVVRGVRGARRVGVVAADAGRATRALARWLDAALGDLDALRLALPDRPEDEFFAAGAPWFFTLFGRDSLWAARLALPRRRRDRGIHSARARAAAGRPGRRRRPPQQPGKILHELRSAPLELPGEGIAAAAAVLRHRRRDAAVGVPARRRVRAPGCREDEVRALLPALRGALAWIAEYGDGDGDGFIDYIDETGHGLANQGWKDSGDSIQWRDGALAEGPIALCEVQGYAYEAATRGADAARCARRGGRRRRCASGRRRCATRFARGVLGRDARGPLPGDRARRATSARSTR